MSPPCIAFFEGNNGGATTRGVTRDEIVIVIIRTNTSEPVWEDLNAPITADDGARTQATKAFIRHMNDRYQLYGRTLRAWFYHGGSTSTVGGLRALATAVDTEKKPFAVLPMQTFGNSVIADEAAGRGMLVAAFTAFPRSFYQSNPGSIITFRPDLEDEAALAASFICQKLAGRPVKQGDPADAGKTRKFGILYSDRDDEPNYRVLAGLLQRELRRHCQEDAPSAATRSSSVQSGGAQENQLALANLRQQGVTSVVPYSGDAIFYGNAQGWKPELVIPGSHGNQQVDSNDFARLANPSAWRNAFGISFDIRRGAVNEQAWAQAYREGCQNCPEPSFGSDNIPLYEALLMLMWGVQSAGPNLTIANVDKGMHALPQHRSPSPYLPATYFAPGNYSFVKDAMEIWWDPSGDDPATAKPGCYRLPNEGNRYRVGEWTPGDDDAFRTGVCQGSFVER